MTRKTTELIKKSQMPRGDLPNCHDGEGTLTFARVYRSDISQMPTAVRFIHDDTLPPGTSIGYHNHGEEEEYYYVIEGAGCMQLDDEEHRISAGDVAVLYPGGAHGLVNDTDAPLRVIVIGAIAKED